MKVEPSPGLLVTSMVPPSMRAEMLGDGQSETGATVIAGCRDVGLRERLEQAADLFFRHSNSGIADGECHDARSRRATAVTRRTDKLHRALLGEFRSIAEKIDQALLQLHHIDMHHADIGGHIDLKTVGVLVHQRRDQDTHFRNEFAEIHILQDRRSMRPDSILDRSRMSLIRPSRCLPALWILTRSAWLAVSLRSCASSWRISL